MSEGLISLSNVSRFYEMGGETIKALDGVDLTINKNEYVAVIGASGSGKSTMMNILGCLDKPTGGDYVLNGTAVSSMADNQLSSIRNKEIGFIFQSFNLLGRATALANVIQPLIYRGEGRRKRKQMAMDALERVGLKGREGHLPNQLSGGQRQRVAIARALVTNPTIILADEPTGNLDSSTTVEILALFDDLIKNGHTIIVVTHEHDIAQRCKRAITISDGKIISDKVK
ncbi:MAG: macrolide ABC transporter ATP-binding protein [Kordiimonadales bacterium]|nr:MAG: macrolide ABC transporter ATP-binding protein [Kordiimonadales bacterium]